MKVVLIIILVLLALLVLGGLCMAVYMMWTRMMRRPWHKKPCPHALEPYLDELLAMEETLREMGLEDHFAESEGFTLHACLLDRGSKKIAVLVHGIEGCARDRYLDAQYYLDRGYNLLIPDLRGCGLSEGHWYGMGQYERHDLLVWLRLLCARFGDDCQIVLDGVSMGASSVLLTAGDGHAPNLAAVVADCGYTSAREEIAHGLSKFRVPLFPSYPIMRLLMALFARYDMNKAAPRELMRKMKTPVLFIHGEADGYIPCAMAHEMYMLCASEKAIYTVPGARHVGSRVTDRAGCEAAMDAFLGQFITE